MHNFVKGLKKMPSSKPKAKSTKYEEHFKFSYIHNALNHVIRGDWFQKNRNLQVFRRQNKL